jgi:hypothetical protein
MIALAAVGVLAIAVATVALAARGGGGEKPATGSDLTAIRCPLAPSGGGEQSEPAEGSFDTAELIGMSLEDARAKAAQHSCEVVVSLEDGRGLPVPIDVDPRRIYVYTEEDVVTEIEGVGGGI